MESGSYQISVENENYGSAVDCPKDCPPPYTSHPLPGAYPQLQQPPSYPMQQMPQTVISDVSEVTKHSQIQPITSTQPEAVVQEQPQVTKDFENVADSAFFLASIVSGAFCFCGCWWAIVCCLPAFFFAYLAQSNSEHGNGRATVVNTVISHIFSTAAIIFALGGTAIIFWAAFGIRHY